MPATHDTNEKDIAGLLEEAFEASGITHYELAKRLSEIRQTRLGSQDQAIRRIRRLGQTPTDDVARDLARAFGPELDLPDDHFITSRRPHAAQAREAAFEALEEVAQLREQVADLQAEVARLAKRVGSRSRRAAS